MITQRMIRRTHPQTQNRPAKEARKDQDIRLARRLVPRLDDMVQIQRAGDEDEGAEEVRPDVDGLVVQVEEGLEGVGVGGARLAVARGDEGVVAAPGGEVVPEDEEAVLELVLEGLGGGEEGVGGGGVVAMAEGV